MTPARIDRNAGRDLPDIAGEREPQRMRPRSMLRRMLRSARPCGIFRGGLNLGTMVVPGIWAATSGARRMSTFDQLKRRRDMLRATADSVLLEAHDADLPAGSADVFYWFENGRRLFAAIPWAGDSERAIALKKDGEAWVNAEALPDGPKAGEAICAGTIWIGDIAAMRQVAPADAPAELFGRSEPVAGVPAASIAIVCAATNPPEPLGVQIRANGRLVAEATLDEFKRAAAQLEQLEAPRRVRQ